MRESLVPGALVGGRFRVEAPLGRGATGAVYRATQLALGREVALKILHPRHGEDERARARFEREARVASALPHESAVAIYDFGEEEGRVFIAMELLRGAPLRELLGEPFPLSRVLKVAHQIADVLAAAHHVPLVHRDLKPENVFLEREGSGERVRVLDFGLAFVASPEAGPRGRLTVEGVVAGTPEYLSPEQARGLEVGPATDVYALGCMLHELLTGRVPFAGAQLEVLTRHLFAPAPPLRDLRDGLVIPTELDALVSEMLRKAPEARPTAEEVCVRLARIDPDSPRQGRARDDAFLRGRAARMVGAPALPEAEPATDALELAVDAPLDGELVVALAAGGVFAWALEPERGVAGAHALFAPGASGARVTELARAGVPVLTDTDAADMERIAVLLRAGAAEVLPRPVTADELVRRVRRAARRGRRGGDRG